MSKLRGARINRIGKVVGVATSYADVATTSFVWNTVADAVRIKAAGDAADTAAGAGAQSVRIRGLNADFNLVEEVVATAGTSASASTTTEFIRVMEAKVEASGTYGAANTGAVVIEDEAGVADLLTIDAGLGESLAGLCCVPNGYAAKFLNLKIGASTGRTADVRVWARENADVIAAPFSPFILIGEYIGIADDFSLDHPKALNGSMFPEKTDIFVEAQVDASTGDIMVELDLELIKTRTGHAYTT